MIPEFVEHYGEGEMAELASFCVQKMASLEARFIRLCWRAQAAGIDCSDLWGEHPPEPEADLPAVRVVN
jgi:hypothetical protein